MTRTLVTALLLVSALAPACGDDRDETATVVLFDVSASTHSDDVRAQYEETFGLVLDDLEQQGGVLGADVIDDNPLAHGELPVNERFDGCGLLDNGLECRDAAEERRVRAEQQANDILTTSAVGTDVFGALKLAQQFFAAYPDADVRRIVVLSDMVQRARELRFPSITSWSPARVTELVEQAPSVDLAGIEIYVVGVGATTSASLSAEQIDGIERFWTSFLERSGADVAFFGASLAAYPIA